MAVWSHRVDPSPEEAGTFIAEMETSLGFTLHDVVRLHFYERRTDPAHAFPRLESHFDDYLFGQFHLPTSADDSVSEFLEVTFVATFDQVWSVVRIPATTELTTRFLERLDRAEASLESGATVGDAIGRLMTVVVSELESFLDATGDTVDRIATSVDRLADSRNLSRALKDRLPEIQSSLVDVRGEIISLGSVVDQMEAILSMVANDHDKVDLHRHASDGTKEELFGKSTEIHLLDTWFRARRVKVLQDEQLEQLGHLSDRMSVLIEHDELTSGRFMGAIASIMLVPTFLVGMYGMNFDKMPELHWHMGYGSVIGLIVVVTIVQIWFFRRRRWI